MNYTLKVTKPRERKISILHPSTKRAKRAAEVVQNIAKAHAGAAQIEYIMAIETADFEDYKRELAMVGYSSDILHPGDYGNCVKAINAAAAKSTGDVLMVMSDDFNVFPAFDSKLLEVVSDHDRWALKTYDGSADWIMTFPIMDRVLYEELDYVYNPEYEHMFADTDLAAVCELMGVTITRNDLVFRHDHYSVVGNKDEVNDKNDKTWAKGEQKFLERAKKNFGLSGKLTNKPLLEWLDSKGVQI